MLYAGFGVFLNVAVLFMFRLVFLGFVAAPIYFIVLYMCDGSLCQTFC
jgi:hypothetical protein